jgi:uncharacterized protein (TIGR02646 family)
MIRLEKGKKPDVLERNATNWTRELLEKIAAGEEPTAYLLSRYAHHDIKSALLAETHSKCAYCESPLRHVAYGDIEHIVPKAADPSLRFEWKNLTIACDVCNTNKSDSIGVVDPYLTDPTIYFQFYGPLMWAIPQQPDAVFTEERLQLNRDGLVERRRERLEYLRNLIDSAASKRADIRDAMLERASREVLGDKPFSACAKTLLNQLRLRYGL